MKTSNALSLSVLSLILNACASQLPKEAPLPSTEENSRQAARHEGPQTNPAPVNPNDAILERVSDQSKLLVNSLIASTHLDSLSPVTRLWAARGVRESFKSNELAYSILTQTMSSPSNTELSKSLSEIEQSYRRTRNNARFGRAILKANESVINGALETASIASMATGIPAVVLGTGAVSKVTKEALDEVLKQFDKAAQASAEAALGRHLHGLTSGAWKEWDQLGGLPPEQAREKAVELVDRWSSSLLGSLEQTEDEQAARTVYNGFLTRVVVGALADERSLRQLADRYQQADIEENSRNVYAIAKAMTSYSAETNRKIQEVASVQEQIVQSIGEMNDNLKSLRGDIRTVSGDVQFLQEFVFSRMTTEEQRVALGKGLFPEMPADRREALEKKLKILAEREEFERKAVDLLNGAQTLVDIAGKFGVNPQVLATAQKAIQATGAAEKVFHAITTGDGFLSAASAVASLLGINGPDVAEQRHQQVMSRLDQIAAGQAALIEGQQQIMETQKILLEGEKRILESLIAISGAIEDSHRAVMEKLSSLEFDVLVNREMVRAVLGKDIEMCQIFTDNAAIFPGFDKNLGSFRDFNSMRHYFSFYQSEFQDCVKGLQTGIASDEISATYLDLLAYEKRDQSIRATAYINQVYAPVWNFAVEGFKKSRRDEGVYLLASALSLPSETTQHLDFKLEVLSSMAPEPTFAVHRLAKPMAADALIKAVEYLLFAYPYLDLLDSQSRAVPSLEALLTDRERSQNPKGYNLLKKALSLIELAIAQESVVAGDGAIQVLYKNLESTPESTLKGLFEQNSMFGRNFMRYAVRKELERSGNSVLAYGFALAAPGSSGLLSKILVKKWNLQWADGQGWGVRLGSVLIPLPTAEEVMEDRMIYRSEIHRLLRAKEKLVRAIVDFEVDENLSREQKEVFNFLLLQGA